MYVHQSLNSIDTVNHQLKNSWSDDCISKKLAVTIDFVSTLFKLIYQVNRSDISALKNSIVWVTQSIT